MKPMNRVQKEQRADTFVEIIAARAKLLECIASFEQLGNRKTGANPIQRLIADSRVSRGNEADQIRHDYRFWRRATNSSMPPSTSSRSLPSSASAIWAVSKPYFKPMS